MRKSSSEWVLWRTGGLQVPTGESSAMANSKRKDCGFPLGIVWLGREHIKLGMEMLDLHLTHKIFRLNRYLRLFTFQLVKNDFLEPGIHFHQILWNSEKKTVGNSRVGGTWGGGVWVLINFSKTPQNRDAGWSVAGIIIKDDYCV